MVTLPVLGSVCLKVIVVAPLILITPLFGTTAPPATLKPVRINVPGVVSFKVNVSLSPLLADASICTMPALA